ncbi:MAG: ParB/RepB/Spo0J family partition protein [Pirellulales bacterium]
MTKDRRLGRGLAALLGTPLSDVSDAVGASSPAATMTPVGGALPVATATPLGSSPPPSVAAALADDDKAELLHLRVDEIEENPFQPRREFSDTEIASLSESLKEHDLLQPVLVRRVNGRMQLISGERRLRAAIMAGWETIPARVREADDRLVAELAIVENLQRKDLNPVEKALSFKRYIDQHRCTQDELAQRLKLDRSTITNLLRLLELPAQVLDAIRTGLVTAGHARALLPLGDTKQQIGFCERIVREELSVRDVERLVSEQIAEEDGAPGAVAGKIQPGGKKGRSEQVASLEQELRAALGCKVEIKTAAKGRGKITIQFANHDEFERLFESLVEASGRSIKSV